MYIYIYIIYIYIFVSPNDYLVSIFPTQDTTCFPKNLSVPRKALHRAAGNSNAPFSEQLNLELRETLRHLVAVKTRKNPHGKMLGRKG